MRSNTGWPGAPNRVSTPATITTAHIKRYRQALIEANYNPVTIRWKLMIVRRFYDAARNAGLRLDNPAAGVKGPRVRHATEDFQYLSEEELSKLLSAIPDPKAATGWDKLRRMRNQLMVGMMALQALRTIEVERANVEDLTEKGEHLVLLVRGKTKDRIAYLRPDMAASVREYLTLRGPIRRDTGGTPLFSTVGHRPHRLGRPHVRSCTAQCLRLAQIGDAVLRLAANQRHQVLALLGEVLDIRTLYFDGAQRWSAIIPTIELIRMRRSLSHPVTASGSEWRRQVGQLLLGEVLEILGGVTYARALHAGRRIVEAQTGVARRVVEAPYDHEFPADRDGVVVGLDERLPIALMYAVVIVAGSKPCSAHQATQYSTSVR